MKHPNTTEAGTDDGGPAFPTDKNEWHNGRIDGMTLLDYFAGQAQTTLQHEQLSAAADRTGKTLLFAMAELSYEIADHMLAEKRRREEGDK